MDLWFHIKQNEVYYEGIILLFFFKCHITFWYVFFVLRKFEFLSICEMLIFKYINYTRNAEPVISFFSAQI